MRLSCSWPGGVYDYYTTASRYYVQRSRIPHNKWTEYIGTRIRRNSSSNSILQQYFIQVIAPEAATYHVSTRHARDTAPEPVVCLHKVCEQDLLLFVECIVCKWHGGAARRVFWMNPTQTYTCYCQCSITTRYSAKKVDHCRV